MDNLTLEPVTIEIVYSNSETRKSGVQEGQIFKARQEYYKGKPQSKFWFEAKDGTDCIAYDVQHDDDAFLPVTTCKVVEYNSQEEQQIKSDMNRVKAQLKQLNESELFSISERERLAPIYEEQIRDLEERKKLLPLKEAWQLKGRDRNSTLNITVNQPEILSNNQPGE